AGVPVAPSRSRTVWFNCERVIRRRRVRPTRSVPSSMHDVSVTMPPVPPPEAPALPDVPVPDTPPAAAPAVLAPPAPDALDPPVDPGFSPDPLPVTVALQPKTSAA